MNRPHARNSLGKVFVSEWFAALDQLRGDSGVRAVVVRSAVKGVFCAGADLKEREQMSDAEVGPFVQRLRTLMDEIGRGRLGLPPSRVPRPHRRRRGWLRPGRGPGARLGLRPARCSFLCHLGTHRDDPRTPSRGRRDSAPAPLRGHRPGQGAHLHRATRGRTGGRGHGAGEPRRAAEPGRGCSLPPGPGFGPGDRAPGPNSRETGQSGRVQRDGAPSGRLSLPLLPQVDLASGLALEGLCYAQNIPTRDRREGMAAFREKRPPRFTGQ
ncbi:enoyl-CoA hydratase domain-containing protein 2, mitochondrial isoform X3 [Tachyglossus aculeatus]|uniref:enoyl-CoA hydratase domain-containing protein 2, mitochondrial isoform X3 n=1 Tax=Tachyglossus aculeatus TaxID=9261 RepID=UPI0018F78BF6|nr:enoyl-CoA hydratase domain-containing protein 2, mitochondrial isoform X3 [Tachyglossus aculeatus]